jgi:hypothetical protein
MPLLHVVGERLLVVILVCVGLRNLEGLLDALLVNAV